MPNLDSVRIEGSCDLGVTHLCGAAIIDLGAGIDPRKAKPSNRPTAPRWPSVPRAFLAQRTDLAHSSGQVLPPFTRNPFQLSFAGRSYVACSPAMLRLTSRALGSP
jgi:hypothetical protein